jgi:hypothetical protein
MSGGYSQRLVKVAANWRVLALRGLVALLFGLVVLFWPGLIFAGLSLLFGLYAWLTGRSSSYPRSGPPIGEREGGFPWPKER